MALAAPEVPLALRHHFLELAAVPAHSGPSFNRSRILPALEADFRRCTISWPEQSEAAEWLAANTPREAAVQRRALNLTV
jgi:hypothetical protein